MTSKTVTLGAIRACGMRVDAASKEEGTKTFSGDIGELADSRVRITREDPSSA